ncbi:hypothetical protein EK0264_07130 [Epidermidibacterium keratini]|uniref:Type II secretion system protein GspF domain-containing protein n=1 Tax=Epidermidibacterium keratini TaxID=1891644 RepID=A0A7L4YMG6_9ACTN|nr:type II secretion system F family protein [Epidermidibacterium keratini]QHC00073.1 hypothetical protein EK0264_07130 [Epidermidibacterium keratini]
MGALGDSQLWTLSDNRMWALVAALGACAIALWPGRTVRAAARRPRARSLLSTARLTRPHTKRAAIVAGAGLGAAGGLFAGPLPALALAIAGSTAAQAIFGALQARSLGARRAADVETLQSLADELRAGQDIAAAMTVAGDSADSALAPGLRAAGAAVRFGADPGPLLTTESDSPHATRLAALYSLAQARGVPLADAVDDLAALGRAQLAAERRMRSLLAGPNATAVLLCLLPVFGLVMGEAIGASPIAYLTGSIGGGLVLIAGVVLASVGALWTQALVARARGAG